MRKLTLMLWQPRRKKTNEGCNLYRCGTEDLDDAEFPSNKKIGACAKSNFGKNSKVVERISNCFMIEIPKRTRTQKKNNFLRALEPLVG